LLPLQQEKATSGGGGGGGKSLVFKDTVTIR
jgi:hypothetical protein